MKAYIVGACRIPIGALLGYLSPLTSPVDGHLYPGAPAADGNHTDRNRRDHHAADPQGLQMGMPVVSKPEVFRLARMRLWALAVAAM